MEPPRKKKKTVGNKKYNKNPSKKKEPPQKKITEGNKKIQWKPNPPKNIGNPKKNKTWEPKETMKKG